MLGFSNGEVDHDARCDEVCVEHQDGVVQIRAALGLVLIILVDIMDFALKHVLGGKFAELFDYRAVSRIEGLHRKLFHVVEHLGARGLLG